MEGLAGRSSKSLHRSLTTVIGGYYIALEMYLIISPWAEVAILINHFSSDEGEILALVIDR